MPALTERHDVRCARCGAQVVHETAGACHVDHATTDPYCDACDAALEAETRAEAEEVT